MTQSINSPNEVTLPRRLENMAEAIFCGQTQYCDAVHAILLEAADALRSPAGGEVEIAEKLRSAWVRIQRAKQAGKPDVQPVWDAINLLPEAIAVLDRHDEFERDLAAEEALSPSPVQDGGEVGALQTENERLRKALRQIEIGDFGEHLEPWQVASAALAQKEAGRAALEDAGK